MSRQLISGLSRARIWGVLRAKGIWKGHREGIVMEFRLLPQKAGSKETRRLQWRARIRVKRENVIGSNWFEGRAVNLYEACEAIDAKVKEENNRVRQEDRGQKKFADALHISQLEMFKR